MNYLQKKKLAFMSIVNSVKGFIRTITGVFPLTLTNCVDEESITDYTIYGNSVQDGTPTPDNPIEVESVGEKTRNLLRLCRDGETINLAGVKFVVNKDVGITMKGTATGDTVIDVSKDNGFTAGGGTYTLCGCFGGSKSTYYLQTQNGFTDTGRGVTVSEKEDKNIVRLYVKKGTVLDNVTICPMLIKGNYVGKVPDYEPYGYKIPVTVSGKNLFDIDKAEIGSMHDSHGGNLERDNRVRTNYIYVKAGTYCVSTISTSGGVRSSTICHAYSTPLETTHIGAVNATSGTILTGTKAYSIFTILVDCYVRFLFLPMSDSSITDLNTNTLNDFKPQIERGDMPTDYEPYHEPITTNIYLDEPLRKIGDYADYIDFEKGKVVRNVGKYTFTGNETDMGGSADDTACVGYVVHISGLSLTNYKRGLCKHVPVYTYVAQLGNSRLAFHTAANHPYCYVFFKKADFPDLTAKQITKQMYDSGNPLVLYYNRNAPTETPITSSNIPTFRGTSILNADTTIQPSNAEVTYYSTLKG